MLKRVVNTCLALCLRDCVARYILHRAANGLKSRSTDPSGCTHSSGISSDLRGCVGHSLSGSLPKATQHLWLTSYTCPGHWLTLDRKMKCGTTLKMPMLVFWVATPYTPTFRRKTLSLSGLKQMGLGPTVWFGPPDVRSLQIVLG
jgi:hypothetical protein